MAWRVWLQQRIEKQMAKAQRDIYTGVEIGTASTKVLMGEYHSAGVLSLLGYGEAPSVQMCKGEAIDTVFVVEQVKRALAQAEENAGAEVNGPVFLALSGSYLRTLNHVGRVTIDRPDTRISEEDMVRAAHMANELPPPPNTLPLHSYTRVHRLDDGREVLNAVGHSSRSLEVELQHVVANQDRLKTTCGILADALGRGASTAFYTPLAIGCACLPVNSVSGGQLLIDIGAGVTSYAVFTDLGCYHCGQLTVGCEQIANDLAIAFNTHISVGRKMLRELSAMHCSAVALHDGRNRMVTTTLNRGGKGRAIPASSVELVLELRLSELFDVIRQELTAAGAWSWTGGSVLLSGGGAMIPGICELAQNVLLLPAKIARPYSTSGLPEIVNSPRNITLIGLLRSGQRDMEIQRAGQPAAGSLAESLQLCRKVFKALVNW